MKKSYPSGPKEGIILGASGLGLSEPLANSQTRIEVGPTETSERFQTFSQKPGNTPASTAADSWPPSGEKQTTPEEKQSVRI